MALAADDVGTVVTEKAETGVLSAAAAEASSLDRIGDSVEEVDGVLEHGVSQPRISLQRS